MPILKNATSKQIKKAALNKQGGFLLEMNHERTNKDLHQGREREGRMCLPCIKQVM